MDVLATYRCRVGCFYSKASNKSSLGRSLHNQHTGHTSLSAKHQRKRKSKRVKSFSNHRLKCSKYRYRFSHLHFKLLPVFVMFVIVVMINQSDFLSGLASRYTLPPTHQSSWTVYSLQPRRNDIIKGSFCIVKPFEHFGANNTPDSVSLVRDFVNIPNYNNNLVSLFSISDKVTDTIYRHADLDNQPKDWVYHREFCHENYQTTTFFMQNASLDPPLRYPWQQDDLGTSFNTLTTNHTVYLQSNYECSSYGTGTCYYLLGNKGMHMSNGNPRSKASPGEAHLRSQNLKLIKDRAGESVGYITIDGGSGTGFRVCDTYLMSAFHVFSDKIDDLIEQVMFTLKSLHDIPRGVLLSKIKDSLDLDVPVDIAEDFDVTAERMLRNFLDQTANDTEKLVIRLKSVFDTKSLLSRLENNWKTTCMVDFINHGRFYVDWKVIFGNKEIDIIIVDLYPTQKYQNYPRGMLLDERYRQHGGIQLIRYINRNPPEVIVDQNCNVFSSDSKLQSAVEEAITWWERNFPNEDLIVLRDEYKGCRKAIDRSSGRVILKSSKSFIPGSSGSPVIYMLNKEGVPVVEMIYQGGFPPFYYTSSSQRFRDVDIDSKCFFGRAMCMAKLSDCLTEFQKTGLKQLLFSLESIGEPKNIKREDVMTANVRAWEEADTDFYETEVSKVILNKISDDDYPSLSVIGVPGSGKTAAIRHAALHLQNEKGFTVYPIFEPKTFAEKFNMYFTEDTKQVFVLDDPVGTYSIDIDLMNMWTLHNENISNSLSKNTKFLFSLRTQDDKHEVLKFNYFIFIVRDRTVDLNSPEHSLCVDDMKGMLTCLLKTNQLPFRKEILSNIPVEMSKCFPLLCKVFSKEQSLQNNPYRFFLEPFLAMVQIFQKMKIKNKCQYCGLLMCAVFENRLTNEIFLDKSLDSDSERFRTDILKEMNFTKEHLITIKRELLAIDGVYVKHIEERITFVHSVFKDIVIFLNHNPDIIFEHASSYLIRERIRFKNDVLKENESEKRRLERDPFVVFYESEYYLCKLSDRLIRDIYKDGLLGFAFMATNHMIDDNRLFSRIATRLFSESFFFKILSHVPVLRSFIPLSFLGILKKDKRFLETSILCGSMKLTRYLLSIIGNVSDLKLILHTACIAPTNNIKLVRLLVKHGASLNEKTKTSESILHTVVRHSKKNSIELIEYFLKKQLSVKVKNDKNESLLHYLVMYENKYNAIKLAELFVQGGVNLDDLDIIGRSVLHNTVKCVSENDLTLAAFFIQCGAKVNTVDNEGQTALHYVAQYNSDNNMKLAELFIEHGAELDAVDKEGLYIMHYIAMRNSIDNLKLAEVFITHGANLHVVDNEGQTVLHYITRSELEQKIQLTELFIKHGANLNALDKNGLHILHYIPYGKSMDINLKLAELFITYGANLHVVDNEGLTVLHHVAQCRSHYNIKLAELFIEHGAKLDVAEKRGKTALHYTRYVVLENALKLATLFITHGANVDAADNEGRVLLHYNILYSSEHAEDNIRLAELLIKYGANVDAVDNEGLCVLHFIVRDNSINKLKLAELFITHGATLNVVDNEGQTVLHHLARYGPENTYRLAKLLIEHGAKVDISDNKGNTVLHTTVQYVSEQNLTLAALFIEHGAKVNAVNNNGETVLHCTAQYDLRNNVEFAKLFIEHGAELDIVDKEGKVPYQYAFCNHESNHFADLVVLLFDTTAIYKSLEYYLQNR